MSSTPETPLVADVPRRPASCPAGDPGPAESPHKGAIVCDFVLERELGRGAFGVVFECRHQGKRERLAVKVHEGENTAMLRHEAEIYAELRKHRAFPRFVRIVEHADAAFLFMELLDGTVNDFTSLNSRRILLCGMDIAGALAHLHSLGYVHRDVKPDNFMVRKGKGTGYAVVLGDFGLTTSFLEDCKGHVPERRTSGVGTIRYASVRVGRGTLPSRRDDIESLAYSLVELYIGSLPWCGIPVPKNETRAAAVSKVKEDTDFYRIGAPPELGCLIEYTRSLQYEEAPDYDYVTSMLRGRLEMEKRRPRKAV